MNEYNHKKIERKWQRIWDEQKLYQAEDTVASSATRRRGGKFYALIEFPYPSGDGLHVGHPRPYIGMDIIARKRRMEGYNVLYPIGWDAFGLPTENYAIKTGIHPAIVTKRNTKNFKRQIQSLGISLDWSREINTSDPKYYRWTQWLFLQFFKHGLAYKKKMPINWCLSCKIGLANEEVVDGRCERCGGETEKREKEQWMLAITKYADRLDKDLDTVDFAERIRTQQRNWIGRSEGVHIGFKIQDSRFKKAIGEVAVFTTRADTLFGATYLVLAPEHPFVQEQIRNKSEIQDYIDTAKRKTELERTAEGKEKTGVELKGIKAVNPANGEEIPVWVADYVLADYGTGAIMAVPAHDERDLAFAKKYGLPIKKVLVPIKEIHALEDIRSVDYEDELLVDSGQFDGMESEKAKKAITEFVGGKIVTTYKLRDWVFSRQRYWGEPIPIIHCEKCGTVPVPEKSLPVKLPPVANYKPTETGESPLAAIASWINVKCPKCGGPAKRETDTMPNWAGSSWYYLRYLDPKNDKQFVGRKKLAYWSGDSKLKAISYQLSAGPVDWYNGGMEHTTLHLLYSRFWHKFLYDQKLVPTPEPYAKRTSHGLILAEGGEKMSKSKGNVINPDAIVARFGADSLRVYEMFMGPFEQAISWSTDSLVGARRFLEKVWRLHGRVSLLRIKDEGLRIQPLLHQTIKKVGNDIEQMKFNTAVSALMILANAFEKEPSVATTELEVFLKLLAPFAPHLSEELWGTLGRKKSIHLEPWPTYDERLLSEGRITIVVQMNGKTRGTFETARGTDEETLKRTAQDLPAIAKWLQGRTVNRIVVVKDRLVNIVVQHPN